MNTHDSLAGQPEEGSSNIFKNKKFWIGMAVLVIILGAVLCYAFKPSGGQNPDTDLKSEQKAAAKMKEERDALKSQLAATSKDLETAKQQLADLQRRPAGASAEEIKKIVAAATKDCRSSANVTPPVKSTAAPVVPQTSASSPVPQHLKGRGEVRYIDPVTKVTAVGTVNSPQEALAWLETQQNLCTQRLRATPGINPDASCTGLRKTD